MSEIKRYSFEKEHEFAWQKIVLAFSRRYTLNGYLCKDFKRIKRIKNWESYYVTALVDILNELDE